MLDVLKSQGYHTSANMIDGTFKFVKGHSKYSNPTWRVSTFPVKEMDPYSSVGSSDNMMDIIRELNGESDTDNSLFAETLSSQMSQAVFEYEYGLLLQEAIESGQIDMTGYPTEGPDINKRFRSLAQFMKMRQNRKVDRDVFIVTQEGYDHHSENGVGINFEQANDALHNFIDFLIREKLWEDTVIVMGSDFGRSITTNSNGGTDHAWYVYHDFDSIAFFLLVSSFKFTCHFQQGW